MYLRYDKITGLAGKAYNIPVPEPYIEITEATSNKISEGTWFVVDGKLTQEETENYTLTKRLEEIEIELTTSDEEYETALDTPIEVNGKQYKPRWVDDGTYSKLITGYLAGIVTFPQQIYDATKKVENMVEMDLDTFKSLVVVLALKQNELFVARKTTQSDLINEKEEIEAKLEG